jgi:squalene-hopene/tetraprenyl-beta-curcumene cyclase
MHETLLPQLTKARDCSARALLSERAQGGWWEGELSGSALSTATAIIALQLAGGPFEQVLIQPGLAWLIRTQTAEGGWGDTTASLPNLSTTLLVLSALQLCGQSDHATAVSRARAWVEQRTGSLSPADLAKALEGRYGRDRTFSVPILMACAIGGVLGPEPDCWQHVPQLPFELAALPRQWFATLQLPVVSYALPALIAIGIVRLHHDTGHSPLSAFRRSQRQRTLQLLSEIQPESGGYLEATPLTAFVTMALASAGKRRHPVVRNALRFLTVSARPDGSWPIDTNLATWLTTLSVNALASIPGTPFDTRPQVADWLRAQQTHEIHPYTLSAPGAWAWTDLPGGVPDADDTSSALLALATPGMGQHDDAAARGLQWLIGLQNRDGGIPTFCRGWGTLPFDRSTPEITAHALAALQTWRHLTVPGTKKAMKGMLRFLAQSQQPDGSWIPLWFGNEHAREESNPVYGTATVLHHLRNVPETEVLQQRAAAYLTSVQRRDGSWSGAGQSSGPASIEETSVTLLALASALPRHSSHDEILRRGAAALLTLTGNGHDAPASPIGLYFARLWYHERLYPRIFQTAAFAALVNRWQ